MKWKNIPDMMGYQANKYGEIRTINFEHKGITRILKQSKNEKGYLRTNINQKPYRTHRLIAKTFLKNYSDGLEVNHKNGIKTDNCVENLEMVTSKQNSWHRHYVLGKNVIAVNQIDKKTNKILKTYPSLAEAERQTGTYHSSISNVCKGKKKTAGGYIWEYVKE